MLIIKSRRKRPLGLNEPLRHESHKRPVTRRDFLAQGFLTGAATVVLSSGVGSLLAPRRALAGLAQDISDMKAPADCNILGGAGKIPFICFDLAGGDRKSTRLNSSHVKISYAVFCLKKKTNT